MIRIVCQARNFRPDGNLLVTDMKTFDIEAGELEAWLLNPRGYDGRCVIGAEVLVQREEKPSYD